MNSKPSLFSYAVLGVPLGFVGLPLYAHLPKYYADYSTLSLAWLGMVLFVARFIDCFADPWIGAGLDRFAAVRRSILALAMLLLGGSVASLFFLPQWIEGSALLVLFTFAVSVAYLAYSVVMIAFYMRGLRWAERMGSHVRISTSREFSLLVGVLIASIVPQTVPLVLPSWNGYYVLVAVFLALLVIAGWKFLQQEEEVHVSSHEPALWRFVWSDAQARRILLIFLVNAIPVSITTTLFFFFVSDVLHAAAWSGAFLLVYFFSAMLAMPFWAWLAKRRGERFALLGAMSLALLSFSFAYGLAQGAVIPFVMICVISGAAMGGDVTLLPAMFAARLQVLRVQGGTEFGVWNSVSKFTLACAAGISLPLLSALGYVSGGEDVSALRLGYAVVPCVFKIAAFVILWFFLLF